MQFPILCDRMTHNYLKVKLNGEPLRVGNPMWDWIYLMGQTKKLKNSAADTHIASLNMTYLVEVNECDPRRYVNFLNIQESYMFCMHVEYFILTELLELLDDSDNYNDTFFEFQEKYWLSEMDISRDRMYKLLERVHRGEVRQRYWDGVRESK